MATTTLLAPGLDVAGAAQLIAQLETDGVPIVAAFWRYPTESKDWRLVIASPIVDREGSWAVYHHVTTALQALPAVQIPLSGIVAVGTDDPVVAQLRSTVPPDFSLRNGNTTMTVRDDSLEDAALATVYLYRLLPQGTPAA